MQSEEQDDADSRGQVGSALRRVGGSRRARPGRSGSHWLVSALLFREGLSTPQEKKKRGGGGGVGGNQSLRLGWDIQVSTAPFLHLTFYIDN